MSSDFPDSFTGFYQKGEHDLRHNRIFNPLGVTNPYLNYGLTIPGEEVYAHQRYVAQKRLCLATAGRLAFKSQNDLSGHKLIIAAGCGTGAGEIDVWSYLSPARDLRIHGIDSSPDQIDLATRLIGTEDRVSFSLGNAGELAIQANQSFPVTGIYSVEAVQHFSPDVLTGFINSSHAVLTPGGRIAFSTFFATETTSVEHFSPRYPTVAAGLDFMHNIGVIRKLLLLAGFEDIQIESIGRQVFPGLAQWVKIVDPNHNWVDRFVEDLDAGMLDYYIVSAQKT